MQIMRTMLFVPSNRERMLEKALGLPTDAYILDLEGSVLISEKPAARQALAGGWLARPAGTGQPVFARINAAFSGETTRDLEAVVGPHLAGVILPKAEPDAVAQVDQWLAAAEQQAGLGIGKTGILPLIETARGVELAYQVATASRRVIGLSLGTGEYGDLSVSLGWRALTGPAIPYRGMR